MNSVVILSEIAAYHQLQDVNASVLITLLDTYGRLGYTKIFIIVFQ